MGRSLDGDLARARSGKHPVDEVTPAAASLKREIEVFRAADAQALDGAYAARAERGMRALLVADDPIFSQRRDLVVALAARHRLPAMYYSREFVEDGGLVSYGSSGLNNYRLGGTYVARVLKGESPATLPVLQPTAFELVINMKTAKALGLVPPPSLLAAADETLD